MKKVRIAGLTVLLSATAMLAYMYELAHETRVLTHTVKVKPSAKKKMNVFFISDIHKRTLPQQLIDHLRTCSIDVLIVGGDVAERGVPLERIERNMRMLASVGPLFYIFGNNDKEVGRENITRVMEKVGATVLVDSTVAIPGHPGWGLCGLQDRTNGQVDLVKAIHSAQRYEQLILAVHNPSLIPKIEGQLRPVLSVAGHTHGGQIRFGSWGIQDLGCFEENENGAKLISNGYGTTKLPLRLGAKPECHVVEVHY